MEEPKTKNNGEQTKIYATNKDTMGTVDDVWNPPLHSFTPCDTSETTSGNINLVVVNDLKEDSALSTEETNEGSAPDDDTKPAAVANRRNSQRSDSASPPPKMFKADTNKSTFSLTSDSIEGSEHVFSNGTTDGNSFRKSRSSRRKQKRSAARRRRHNRQRTTHEQVLPASTQPVPILPPEVWEKILDFSVFDDVARMARVSPAFLHETMPLLKSLYIVNDAAFTTGANQVNRFRAGRLQEIYVDCMLEISPFDLNERDSEFAIISSRPTAFIDFVSALPSIKHVFFGNGTRESKNAMLHRLQMEKDPATHKYAYVYRTQKDGYCLKPRQDSMLNIYRDLLYALVESYRSGTLSQDVSIYGMPPFNTIYWWDCYFVCLDRDEREKLCYAICDVFPLEHVRHLLLADFKYASKYFPHVPLRVNIDLDEALRKVLKRVGGKEMLATTDSSNLFIILGYFYVRGIVGGSKGVKYRDECIQSLRTLVQQVGLDASVLNGNDIMNLYTNNIYLKEEGLPLKYCESQFRILTELGFSLDANMVMLVPDEEFTTEVSI